MARELRFGEADRQKMLAGVNALAAADQLANGPRGRNLVSERSYGAQMLPPSHYEMGTRWPLPRRIYTNESLASERDSAGSTQECTDRVLALCAPFTASMTFFKNTTAHTLPMPRNNEEKLADIGFSEAMLDSEDEKERYRNYCCLISTKIMTDPVHAPDYPQFDFERSDILRWLRIKQEHPFNRTTLRSEQLVQSVTLKQDINKFVDDTVAAFHQSKNSTQLSING